MDPFAGSGSILRAASLFQPSLLLSSDSDPLTCTDAYVQARGSTVVCAIESSPWRGVVDAVVCDPPYSIRTALLRNSDITYPIASSTSSPSLSPSSSPPAPLSSSSLSSVLPSSQHSLNPSKNTEKRENNTEKRQNNTEKSLVSVLSHLISFASQHLVSKGRLVFWWPDGTYVRAMLFSFLYVAVLVVSGAGRTFFLFFLFFLFFFFFFFFSFFSFSLLFLYLLFLLFFLLLFLVFLLLLLFILFLVFPLFPLLIFSGVI